MHDLGNLNVCRLPPPIEEDSSVLPDSLCVPKGNITNGPRVNGLPLLLSGIILAVSPDTSRVPHDGLVLGLGLMGLVLVWAMWTPSGVNDLASTSPQRLGVADVPEAARGA